MTPSKSLALGVNLYKLYRLATYYLHDWTEEVAPSSKLWFETKSINISAQSRTSPDPPIEESQHRERQLTGRLEVTIGPMFSGKTTALLKKIREAEDSGKTVMAVKSEIDTRGETPIDSRSHIISHDGVRMPCVAVTKLSSLKGKDLRKKYEEAEVKLVIAIDEAQFFTSLHAFCLQAVDGDAKTVFVAGLDADYLRRPFKLDAKHQSEILRIIPLADSVTKLSAVCSYCYSPAPFTMRTTPDDRQVLIGGEESYRAVCRHCYNVHSRHRENQRVDPFLETET